MKTLCAALEQAGKDSPDRTALVQGDQSVTYGQLWNSSVAVAWQLRDLGVEPGDRVVLAAPSEPRFAAAYFGAHLAGGVAVPLDPQMPSKRAEGIIERAAPKALIGISGSGVQALPMQELRETDSRSEPPQRPTPDLLGDVVFTTGTTGAPKGVCLTHGAIAAAVNHINQVIGLQVDDTQVVPIPLYHSFGLGRLRCAISVGAKTVLVKGFRLPGEVLGALSKHEATALAGVPAGFAVLLPFGERGLGTVSKRLRHIEIGSASMPMAHKQQLIQLLPNTKLFMHYGLTEASRSAFIEFHSEQEHLNTVGKPAPGVRAEVRDSSGKPCPTGEPGVLWINGPHLASGYWKDEALSSRVFVAGWVRTGDVAHIDAAGRIQLHGREDDMINTGGFKVSPEEVERALMEHPAIAEAACVAMPDPKGIAGNVVRGVLVAAPASETPDPKALSQWLKDRLEPYKIPVRYDWVEQLPRSASGKLKRAELRSESSPKAEPATGAS